MGQLHMANGLLDIGGRIRLRPVEATYEDGFWISYWRNRNRHWYFTQTTVTPESHMIWWYRKAPYDNVWMVYPKSDRGCQDAASPLGMTSLTIDAESLTGEYGRTVVDSAWQGRGYGTEIEYTCMLLGFELFNLRQLWGELVPTNPIARIHERIGWTNVGVNVPGHLHAGVDTLYIECTRPQWADMRQAFALWMSDINGQRNFALGDWTP